ncbi:hypothetical protein JOD43_003530 [Pullulanibacillus pueri]|uniref:Uncharacterized protein n=1 Tax=Pullulanibacillus pueri TaxID=1437324 RepID=A0A8J3ENN2_9BACL|nr:hypothetical protein [Pullulanibacillus pueri]MBM7683350.1 hypothetical protein [Pullulanibacillus pueri]GGH86635.1 hypothetical protein GCM10007096_34800 [Pullulanibacillus pueri]
MIKIKLKLNNKRFTFPIPYIFLRFGGRVISSRVFYKVINRSLDRKGQLEPFLLDSIDQKVMKEFLKTVRYYKGLTIVEVKEKNGTEVIIRL